MSLPGGNFIANGLVVHNSNFLGEGKVTTGSSSSKAEDKATMIYNALARRVSSRYKRHGVKGLVLLVSSKRSTEDFTERRIRRAIKDDDAGLFVRDYAIWNVHPEPFEDQSWHKVLVSPAMGRTRLLRSPGEVAEAEKVVEEDPNSLIFEFPDDYWSEFDNDCDGATRDIAGIATDFAGRLFIANRTAITEMFDSKRPHWFKTDEWNTGRVLGINWDHFMGMDLHNEPICVCCPGSVRHVHIDLSTTHCATGFCIGHLAGSVEVWRRDPETQEKIKEEAPVIHIDAALRVTAPDGEDVDHSEVRGLVYRLMEKGVPIRSVSMDQYMGPSNLQLFKRRGLRTSEIGERKLKLRPYMASRQAIYEHRVLATPNAQLEKELKDLELDATGKKVKHPPKGCFTGDTKVRLLDGRRLSFEELVEEFGDGRTFYVYTIRDGAVSVGAARSPRLTAKNAEIVAVTLDNGEVVRCTPDHRFMLRDGSYKEASDLVEGDSLMPLYTKLPKKSKDGMSGYELYLCPKDGKWHFTHRMVGKWKYPDVGYTGQLRCSISLVERRFMSARKAGIAVARSPYQRRGKKGNHQVVSVVTAGRADVYDITVEDTQNFALEAGVFVHNSKDLADAWAGVVYYFTERSTGGVIAPPSKGITERVPMNKHGAQWSAGGNVRWSDEGEPADEASGGFQAWIVK